MRKIRIFISQPMSGLTAEKIKETRNNVIQKLADYFENVEFIDSFNENALNNSDPIAELGKCVSMMSGADFVFFCKGWENSRGCQVKHCVAVKYDVPQIYEDEDKRYPP